MWRLGWTLAKSHKRVKKPIWLGYHPKAHDTWPITPITRLVPPTLFGPPKLASAFACTCSIACVTVAPNFWNPQRWRILHRRNDNATAPSPDRLFHLFSQMHDLGSVLQQLLYVRHHIPLPLLAHRDFLICTSGLSLGRIHTYTQVCN